MTEINIFDLPEEVLAEIFSFVSDHRSLSETCWLFNKISSETKLFAASINIELLCDDEPFNSMTTSSRRFKRLHIDRGTVACWWALRPLEDERLRQLVKHIGPNIKELIMTGMILSTDFIHVFNLMPNLEKIIFRKVEFARYHHYEKNEVVINLPKLKEINCTAESRYDALFLELFTNLLPGVLQKLTMTKIYSSCVGPVKIFFENQHNIEDIEIHCPLTDLFNFKKFKLKNLKVHSWYGDLEKIIKGQREMRRFDLDGRIGSGDLKMVCCELKSLVYLNICVFEVEDNEFTYLSKLKNLKSLKLNWKYFAGCDANLNACLSLAASDNLQELDMECNGRTLTWFTLTHLGINMPELNHLRLSCKSSISELNSIVQHFQKLESLEFSTQDDHDDRYRFENVLSHGNLKKILLPSRFEVDEDFARLVGCCKELEELTISYCVNAPRTARQVLAALPNLKYLSMVSDTFICLDLVESLMDHGKRLNTFICKQPIKQPFWFMFDYEYFDDMNKKIQQEFSDKFEIVSFDEDKWVMTNDKKQQFNRFYR